MGRFRLIVTATLLTGIGAAVLVVVLAGDDRAADGGLAMTLLAATLVAFGLGRRLGAVDVDTRPRAPLLDLGPPNRGPQRPRGVMRWQGAIATGSTNARAADLRLRPALHDLARARLADRHGIDLDHQPGPAETILGTRVHTIVRRHTGPSGEVDEPGIPPAEVDHVVSVLETL